MKKKYKNHQDNKLNCKVKQPTLSKTSRLVRIIRLQRQLILELKKDIDKKNNHIDVLTRLAK